LIKQVADDRHKKTDRPICTEPVKTDIEEKEPPVVELTTTGGFAMPRSYTHMKALEKEIFEQKGQGKSNREVREQYGLSKKQMKNLITRHNQRERLLEAGILPRRRGRPPKGYKFTESEKDNEIKRLKMENELLRDFLRAAGRM
jgi:hypothetical protein